MLRAMPRRFDLRILAGPTGSAKSKVLRAIEAAGGQTLDLERLACHRGSLLGSEPGEPQPAQKLFESLVHHRL